MCRAFPKTMYVWGGYQVWAGKTRGVVTFDNQGGAPRFGKGSLQGLEISVDSVVPVLVLNAGSYEHLSQGFTGPKSYRGLFWEGCTEIGATPHYVPVFP